MDIKWVFIDIDGTLINSDYQISARNKKAVKAAVDIGVNVTIASGRMYRSVVQLYQELGICQYDLPVITYHGGLVATSFSNQVLLETPLVIEDAMDLIDFARKEKITAHAYLDDSLIVDYINDDVADYCLKSVVPVKAVKDIKKYLVKAPLKLLYSGDPEYLDNIWEILNKRYGEKVYITKSKPEYLEFMNPLANKGEALKFLTHKFSINKEEIMAIGDSFNDLKFFKGAGLKVAMGNGVDELKAAADFITADCDHDGVAIAIEKFVL